MLINFVRQVLDMDLHGEIIEINTNYKTVYGVFSGDTIIHKDFWGSFELYRVFLRFFINYGKKHKEFYWFLISKGYKTYKMLPLCFNKFYPCHMEKTPDYEQNILNSFGKEKFPKDYDEKSGVICYQSIKDRLKTGIADITDKHLTDKNIKYFVTKNTNYMNGNDLVCITHLTEDNLNKAGQKLLFGR